MYFEISHLSPVSPLLPAWFSHEEEHRSSRANLLPSCSIATQGDSCIHTVMWNTNFPSTFHGTMDILWILIYF